MRWIPLTSGRKQHLMATSVILGLVVMMPMVLVAKESIESTGQWSNFTESFLKASGKNGFRHALAVERTTGNLFVSRWGTGVWMSVDQGVSFNRADGNKVSAGGPFSCYDLFIAPEGGKIAVFNMNNNPGPSGYSLDGGKTWESFESVGRNWDYGAVDWESKSVFAARHEHDGMHLSADMGKTWTTLDIKRGEIEGLGVFSAKELVISTWKGIKRSEDAGKTWAKVSDFTCTGTVQMFNGTAYWLSNKNASKQWSAFVLVSKDKGRTWQEAGKPVADTMFCSGPCFGKDANHMVVATLKGIMESTDAGQTWKVVTEYPPETPLQAEHKNGCGFPALGYDPDRDVFYLSLVNMKAWSEGPLLKYTRKK